MTDSKRGKIVVVSGPSGVGKSTICAEIISQVDNAYLSISCTTRDIGSGEVEGRNYNFITRDEFKKRISAGEFVEYADVFGNFYGTPRSQLDHALKNGEVVILEIDVQGGIQIKEKYPEAVMIFILPPKQKDLASRIDGRGRDQQDAVEKRLACATNEIAAAWQHYTHMVINDELQAAIKEVVEIIENG